jgi:hypothetical protein
VVSRTLPIPILGYDSRPLATTCSTDASVWPSVCPNSDSRRGFQGLWSRLPELLQSIPKACPSGHMVVAFARLSPLTFPDSDGWEYMARTVWQVPSLTPVVPRFVEVSWELLGYDVSDYYLWSSLHSSVPHYGEHALLDDVIENRLNSHGLLDSFLEASEAAIAVESLIEARAPFFPYGVFATPHVVELHRRDPLIRKAITDMEARLD